ncbi:hypothetical protein FA95DRAFT_181554 [Auriscalpium vulgare]|uniref:Uncharacterized protein n=1 Tax=Auriscalpium vulgare TaxID=40419 RepID=A0ACB8RLB9_9AGAM|nr:hypothetical protein FA95DRAFT_181554 [Auriscalpium vulgare]
MSAPPLPFDIHARIIQFVYILSQSHDIDYRTLSACALVCKDWTAPAQRLLFRRIIRPSDTKADTDAWLSRATLLLLRALTSRPHLGTYVRALAVHALPNRVELLRLCPSIALLHLVGDTLPWLEWLHKLRALRLRPSVLVVSPRADRDMVHAALAALPSVRHLVKDSEEDLNDDRLLDLALPSATQLLSVTSGSTIDFSKLCVQPAVVPAAEIMFEDLVLRYTDFQDMTTTSVIRGVARSLRALTTEIMPTSAELKELTALESLVVGLFPSWSVPSPLPRTLRHFGFHAHYDTPIYSEIAAQCVREFAATLSGLPNLRVISVTCCSNYDVRHALQEVSVARGVDFVEYADPHAYPRARYVDWLW